MFRLIIIYCMLHRQLWDEFHNVCYTRLLGSEMFSAYDVQYTCTAQVPFIFAHMLVILHIIFFSLSPSLPPLSLSLSLSLSLLSLYLSLSFLSLSLLSLSLSVLKIGFLDNQEFPLVFNEGDGTVQVCATLLSQTQLEAPAALIVFSIFTEPITATSTFWVYAATSRTELYSCIA